jgi:hypothetical protein
MVEPRNTAPNDVSFIKVIGGDLRHGVFPFRS